MLELLSASPPPADPLWHTALKWLSQAASAAAEEGTVAPLFGGIYADFGEHPEVGTAVARACACIVGQQSATAIDKALAHAADVIRVHAPASWTFDLHVTSSGLVARLRLQAPE
jgi:hypothetical protein